MDSTGPRGPRQDDAPVSMSAARAGVLAELRHRGRECSVRELAASFDLHPNTVREHLDALVDDGLAARGTTSPHGRGRPALVYRAMGGTMDAARDYELLTEVLADQVALLPDPHQASLSAGRAWGERMLHAGECQPGARGVERVMTRMGFDPTRLDGGETVLLRGCPILAAAQRNPDVVCTVHLGLARAIVEADGQQGQDVTLEVRGHPEGCLLRLPGVAQDCRPNSAPGDGLT